MIVRARTVTLAGDLSVPESSRGLVLFAHGSGSSRLSPRNHYVAGALYRRDFGTLLFDLLTEAEAVDRAKVFDIALLGERLLDATAWIHAEFPNASIGYFGASTGAAAALMAAARCTYPVRAVVSRGGRPDLAAPMLPEVTAPTLLIVGSLDETVLEWNENATEALGGTAELAVVRGATHLFEEPGALEQVASLAADWFQRYMAGAEPADQSSAPRA